MPAEVYEERVKGARFGFFRYRKDLLDKSTVVVGPLGSHQVPDPRFDYFGSGSDGNGE